MRITTVTYRELVSGPGYHHRAFEATASVDAGESPERALAELVTWVRQRHVGLGERDERVTGLLEDERRLEAAITHQQRKLQALEDRFRMMTWWSFWRAELRRRWRVRLTRWRLRLEDDVPF